LNKTNWNTFLIKKNLLKNEKKTLKNEKPFWTRKMIWRRNHFWRTKKHLQERNNSVFEERKIVLIKTKQNKKKKKIFLDSVYKFDALSDTRIIIDLLGFVCKLPNSQSPEFSVFMSKCQLIYMTNDLNSRVVWVG